MTKQSKHEPQAGGTRPIQDVFPLNNHVLAFPVHRRRGIDTLPTLVRRYRLARKPRGDYRVPMPEDFAEVLS